MKHPTKHVHTVTVVDPDTGGNVEIEIRKDTVTGAMIGIDGSYLSNTDGPVFDPYNKGEELDIPDSEQQRKLELSSYKDDPATARFNAETDASRPVVGTVVKNNGKKFRIVEVSAIEKSKLLSDMMAHKEPDMKGHDDMLLKEHPTRPFVYWCCLVDLVK